MFWYCRRRLNGGGSARSASGRASHVLERCTDAWTGIDGGAIDDVIVGCVGQSGAQAGNIAIELASKSIPEHVLWWRWIVNKMSQQLTHFAAQAT